jgi:cellulose synthase/poly-beta-1,6-N-acetylglucosamine synthase-like glycosyltransferase
MIVIALLCIKILAWLIALLWLWKAISAAYGLRRVPNLNEPPYNQIASGDPSITVIVPARNEAAKVGACLQSLLDQQQVNLRILAVDDRSTDSTGAIMDALALEQPARLRALHITELPTGWLGKTHAMAFAARHAIALHNPDYLLFTDADVIFRSDALRLALAHAEATNADHLVVFPTTLVKSIGEGMLLAYLQVMGLWAVRTWQVSNPKAMRDAVGVGAFNLLKTSVYQQLGGFDGLRMEIVEDLSLGRRVKLAGLRQRIATAPGLASLHWASGVFGILNGMTKNLFAIFKFRIALALLSSIWIFLFCVAPTVLLVLRETRVPAAITLIAVTILYMLSSRQSRISPWYATLFPVSAILIIYSLILSMYTTLKDGGVTWRGTFYSLTELRRNQLLSDSAASNRKD